MRTPTGELAAEELLSVAAAAAIAGRSIRTIRRAYAAGSLAAYRDGGGRSVRIRGADLHDWLLRERLEPDQSSRPRAIATGEHPAGFSDNLRLLRAARSSKAR